MTTQPNPSAVREALQEIVGLIGQSPVYLNASVVLDSIDRIARAALDSPAADESLGMVPIGWTPVTSTGQRNALLLYKPSQDYVSDLDRKFPANAPHRLVPVYTREDKPLKVKFTEEWCMKMAALEGDSEIGAGLLARAPQPAPEPEGFAAIADYLIAGDDLADQAEENGLGNIMRNAAHRLRAIAAAPPAKREGDV